MEAGGKRRQEKAIERIESDVQHVDVEDSSENTTTMPHASFIFLNEPSPIVYFNVYRNCGWRGCGVGGIRGGWTGVA